MTMLNTTIPLLSIKEEEHLDNYHIGIKLSFSVLNGAFVIFGVLALVALNKTKRTPKTARFLSSFLILFDILAVSFFTIRRFVVDHNWNIIIQVTGVAFCYNAFVTIGLMSLERFVLFNSPNFYIRCLSTRKIKTTAYCAWLFGWFLYFYTRIGICYTSNENPSLHDVIGKCNQVTFIMYILTIIIVMLISYLCYWKIFRIVKSDHIEHGFRAISLQQYKSTSLVFVYVITVSITAVGYMIAIASSEDRTALRISNDLVNMFNAMMDPCVYVLWYKECRMEMMKMLTCGLHIFKQRFENMRMEIFEVVTMDASMMEKRSNSRRSSSALTHVYVNPVMIGDVDMPLRF